MENQRSHGLTIVIDDFSRAIAGYYFGFDPPFSLRASLALRQGIWAQGSSTLAYHWDPRSPIHRQRFKFYIEASRASVSLEP
jgi:transposase InsO family protein